jgi:hypothetical protein
MGQRPQANLEKSVNVVKSDAEWRKTLTPKSFA